MVDVEELFNCAVVDSDGEKIGKVNQVYLDDATGEANWVTIRTGLFGLKETFAPLDRAIHNGDELKLNYTADKVKGAPNVDPDAHLDAETEAELYTYYGIAVAEVAPVQESDDEAATVGTTAPEGGSVVTPEPVDDDTVQPVADTAEEVEADVVDGRPAQRRLDEERPRVVTEEYDPDERLYDNPQD